MRVRATKTVEYEIRVVEQSFHDHDDDTGPGFYAWVGPPGDESVFVMGPCKSHAAARTAALKMLERRGYTVEKA